MVKLAGASMALALLVVATGSPVGDGVPCALPAGPSPRVDGQILVTAEDFYGSGVYALDPDAGTARRLAFFDGSPRRTRLAPGSARLSPDGGQMAWQRHNWRRGEVYVARSDGSDVRRITNNEVEDGVVGWAPDGSSVVVARKRSVFVVAVDGARERRIELKGILVGTAPISSSGRLAFVRLAGHRTNDVYVADPPWRRASFVAQTGLFEDIALSPDGRSIALSAYETAGRGSRDVVVVDADGDLVSLAPTPAGGQIVYFSDLSWSPDGSRVMFVREISPLRGRPARSLIVTAPDGGCARSFELPAQAVGARWSPAGDRIALSMYPEHGSWPDVYVLDLETGSYENITNTPRVGETVADWGASG